MPTTPLGFLLIVHFAGLCAFALPLGWALQLRLRARDLTGRLGAATSLNNARTLIAVSMGILIFSGLALNYVTYGGFRWEPSLKMALEVVLWGAWGLSEIVILPKLEAATTKAEDGAEWHRAETRAWTSIVLILLLATGVAALSIF